MKQLYFTRHGLSEDNAHQVFGAPYTPLTEQGRQQAIAAGKQAKADGLHFDLIIASPLPRAQETARLLAAELGFPLEDIETDELLQERHFGVLAGTPFADFFTGERTYQDTEKVEDAESIEHLQERAAAVLAKLQNRPEDVILVVSHDAFGRAFRRAVHGIPYTDEFREAMPRDHLPNATIFQLI